MKLASPFLVGMTVLGLQMGSITAAEPATTPSKPVLTRLLADEPVGPAHAPPVVPGVIDSWGGCCDACCGQVIGGVGFYLVQPYFESNPAYIVVREVGGKGNKMQVADRVDLSHNMEVAPQLWLGYIGESGLGVRGRWWYFRQGSDQTLALPPSDPGTNLVIISAVPLGIQAFSNTDSGKSTGFAVTSNLVLQVGDIEALQGLQIAGWDFLFSGGLRIAHINQHYNVYSGDTKGEAALWRSIQSGHSFNGAGPVIAVEAHRPLAGTGFGLFGSARGAVLFGSAKQNALFIANALRNDDASPSGAVDHRSRVLPVAELEIGVEYRQNVGMSQFFGQIALVGQDWFGAGNASRSANHAFPGGFPVGGAAVDSDLGFLGLGFRVGLNY
jgi:hypothetical protein